MIKKLVCTKCKKEKSIVEFRKNSITRNGYTSICLVCHREHVKQQKLKKYFAPIEYKTCKDCGDTYHKSKFYIEYYNTTGLSTRCKECAKKLSRKNRVLRGNKDNELRKLRYLENKEKYRLQKRNYILANPEKNIFYKAKSRAKRKNIEFNLDLKDIIIPSKCPILDIPLKIGTRDNYENSPSIDRIDNSMGYIKNNTQIISSLANTMKNSATKDNLINFSFYMLKFFKMI